MHIVLRFVVMAVALVPLQCLAQDFDAGLSAFEAGDFATAFREWKPLAEQGDVGAQYMLAFMFEDGNGVPKDFAEAFKWYRLAAEQGDVGAQQMLGFKFEYGEGVPQNFAEAVKWYRLAAEQGSTSAQDNLGEMYAGGKGVPQDNVSAHMWFNLSAAAGASGSFGREHREGISEKMTREEIAQAQRRAKVCLESNYMNCD